jgi:CBS domain containing-hemolysin-like protein
VRWASAALIWLSRLVTPGGDEDQTAPDVTESELLAMADFAVDEDVIETEERALIHSIIEFGDTIVREVMVPRTDLVAVDGSVPAGEALGRAIDAGFSRIPVYNGNIDDVVGIAYTKDLIRATREGREHVPVREVVRGAPYVPETKRVAPLMREMQSERVHIAIVIDEYGGTAGVVTLEDLIEELVGEIADEYDLDEPLVERVSEHEYRVSARMPVDEVNELLQVSLPTGDWDTVGGLVLHLLGHVPLEGESIDSEGYRLTAERVQGRRIGRVRIGNVVEPITAPAEDALGAGRDARHGR